MDNTKTELSSLRFGSSRNLIKLNLEMMPESRRIRVLLPFAALVIAGLCAYKLTRPSQRTESTKPIAITRPAPLFELYDQRKPPQIVRLKSYIGRHRIVLVFFDPKTPLADDPVLVWIRNNADAIRGDNAKVLAISTDLPQNHRRMLEEFLDKEEPSLFQLLSDLDGTVHKLYGRFDAESEAPLKGVFLIDRAGNLNWNDDGPIALDDPIQSLVSEFEAE